MAFRSSVRPTPAGTGRGCADPPIRTGLTATDTSPFAKCTSCRPDAADTDCAPCNVSEPPAIVTEFVPLETVIVPGEFELTVNPLPFPMTDLVTPFDKATGVAAGDGPVGAAAPPADCDGG